MASVLIELTQPSETLRRVVITLSAQNEELETVTDMAEVKFILVPQITLGEIELEYENMPLGVVQKITVPVLTEDIDTEVELNARLVKDGMDVDTEFYTVTGQTTDSNGIAIIQIMAGPEITVGEYTVIVEYTKDELSEKAEAQQPIVISNILINQIIINQTAIAMEVGERTILTYDIIPSSFSDEDLQFISENEEVATITGGGLVTAVGKGETIVKIASLDGTVEATCTIAVLQPSIEILELTTSPETLKQGEDGTINVKIAALDFQSGKNLDIGIYKHEQSVLADFTIEGNSVQNNEVNLKITPNKEVVTSGEYKISVTYNGKQIQSENIEKQSRTFQVHANTKVTGIEIDKERIFITKDAEKQLQVRVLPETANNKKLIWSIDNTDVAIIDEQGLLETLEKGKATITVYSDENPEISKTIDLRVIDLVETEEYTMDVANKKVKDIPVNTTVEVLLENMQIGSDNYAVTNHSGQVITGETLVGTDMQITVNDEVYKLIVVGDINGDGRITPTDLSKLKLHIVELEVLEGNPLLGSDMNKSGTTTLTDLSRMAEYIVGL